MPNRCSTQQELLERANDRRARQAARRRGPRVDNLTDQQMFSRALLAKAERARSLNEQLLRERQLQDPYRCTPLPCSREIRTSCQAPIFAHDVPF